MNEKGEFDCIICGKQQEVLVSVKVKGDVIFCHNRGVCQNCLKNKDINKVCKEFSIRKVKEKISDLKVSTKMLETQLEELMKG